MKTSTLIILGILAIIVFYFVFSYVIAILILSIKGILVILFVAIFAYLIGRYSKHNS